MSGRGPAGRFATTQHNETLEGDAPKSIGVIAFDSAERAGVVRFPCLLGYHFAPDDAAGGVDQKHAGGEAIEDIGENRCLGGLESIALPMSTARRTCGTTRRMRDFARIWSRIAGVIWGDDREMNTAPTAVSSGGMGGDDRDRCLPVGGGPDHSLPTWLQASKMRDW